MADESTTRTREEVEAALAETKGRAHAASAAVQSAERLYSELLNRQAALEAELRALNLAPNATMTGDLLEPFAMSAEIVTKNLKKGERVQAEKGASEYSVLLVQRADGRTFRVAPELVVFDADAGSEASA